MRNPVARNHDISNYFNSIPEDNQGVINDVQQFVDAGNQCRRVFLGEYVKKAHFVLVLLM